MKPEGKGLWKGLSGIAFIISAIVLGLGLDKMFNYDSGEYYPYEYHNAYVGGDAYNYIINGNYATGFFVLATMFALMGIGFIVLYYLSKMADGQVKLLYSNQTLNGTIAKNSDITYQNSSSSNSDADSHKEYHQPDWVIICPKCHTKQPKDRTKCWECGYEFTESDKENSSPEE